MHRLARIGLITTALGTSLFVEQAAFALQGGEDPALLPVLVDKRYGAGGRHQLSLYFSTPLVTKFVQSTGGYLTYTYNFSDLLGVEVGGGFFASGETGIMDEIRQNFPNGEPPLRDLYQMVWAGQADIVLTPLYGKLSFAAELDPAFDLYLMAGGGVAGLKRKCSMADADTGCTDTGGSISKTAPAFNAGFGFHFYFTRSVAVRIEIRDMFYPEQDTSRPPGSASQANGGFTFNLQAQAGVQLAFGGEE